MSFFTYLYRRLALYWPVLLTLALGVILAVTLLASGPVMVESVLDFTLRRTLASATPVDANLRLSTTIDPSSNEYKGIDEEVQGLLDSRFGKFIGQVVPMGESRWSHPWVMGEVVRDKRVNLSFYGKESVDLLTQVEFTSGGWPEGSVLSDQRIMGVVGTSMAKEYDLETGASLPISLQPGASQPELWLEVIGILRPTEYQEPFWFGSLSPLQSKADTRFQAQNSVLVPRDQFFDLASNLFPASDVQVAWHVLLAPDSIRVGDIPDLLTQLHALGEEVGDHDLRLETGLSQTLGSIISRTESARAPLYLLITTVVLLALYYVLMVATLSLRQARREFAVLQSRGASSWQLSSVKLVEAILICGVAVLSGPGLALLLMRGLIRFGPLADTSEAYWALTLPQAAWLTAGVGAIACLVGVLSPLPGAIRRSIVTYTQTLSRSGRPPIWQRYYLDVVAMVAGLILLWRLRIYGGLLSETGTGPQVDWLLLLAPVALLLGTATIMLRIFPLLLQLGANVVSELRGLPATLAFWQAARDPGHIARLVLLLTLAMALGSLSSGLNLALDQNEKDRAYYTSGSDIRVQLASEDMRIVKEGVLSDTTIAIQSVNGFRSLSSVVRTTGSLQFTIENAYPAFDVLAIEPGSLQAVSQFRHDFASVPVIDLLDRLEQAKAEEMPYYELPGHPSKIGIWILVPFEGMLYSDQLSRHTSISLDELSLIMKISTSQGEFISVPLSLDAPSEHLIGGWQYFEGLLPSLNTLSYPVKIHSLWFRHLESSSFLTSIIPQLAIDGMTVVDGLTGATTMPGVFESGGPKWISSDPAIHLSMDGLYPKFGKGRLLLDFGLSGTDITDWIGVNLTKEAFQFEHDEPTQIAPGRDEALTDEGYIMSLPGQPTRLGIWVVAPVAGRFEVGPGIFHPVGELSTVDLQVRLRTRTGEELLLPMQSMGEQPQEGYIQDQWQQFWTDITGIAEDQYPLTLEAFRVRVAENTYLPVLVLDNLILIEEEGGEEQVVEEFEGLSPPYWGLYPTSVVGETSLQPRGRAGNGLFIFFDDYGDLGEFGWIEVYPIGERPSVLVVDEGESAQPESRAREGPLLPVIVSSAFMEITQAEVGDRIGVWMGSKPFVLEVTGAVDYFPTMLGEKDAGYVIAPSNLILNDFNLTDYLSFNSNEFFISLDPGIPSDIVIDEIRDVVREDLVFFDKEDLRQMIKSDPLALGLRSITTLGYLLTSVLSLVGFGTYFYMSVRQRRKMYGVLRAIGMSASQIYGSLLLEQVVLILSGLALGTVLGVLLNQLTLPGLPLSLGGQPPIPPFLAETDWGGVFQIYFTLAIAFFISLGFATLSLSRARLHQVLRVDEE